MLVLLHVLAARFLFSRVLPGRILAVTRFGRGPESRGRTGGQRT